MEKFSTWRDASSGIAPFVLPVPTGDARAGPLLLLSQAVLSLFAVVRIALLFLLLGAHVVVDSLVNICLPTVSHSIGLILGWLFLRPALCICFGYFYIPTEVVASKRRSTADTQAVPGPGDIVVANWSSYIDVLYLAFRFNGIFAIPISTTPGKPATYVAANTLRALLFCGRTIDARVGQCMPLESILRGSTKPVIIFPEGTTSNNRALLRFANGTGSTGLPETCKVYLTVLKHDTPSLFLPTVTSPIPTGASNPLPQIFSACLSPVFLPRHLLVKTMPSSEAPIPTSSSFWRQIADSMCAVGKLKQTNLGVEDKVAFLEYYSRPKTKEATAKQKRRS